jgi:hypothetical protein
LSRARPGHRKRSSTIRPAPGPRGLRRAAEALVSVRPSKCKDPRTPLGISPRASGGGR